MNKELKVTCAHASMVPLDQLKPHPKNRNTHPPKQIERLAKLIGYQGMRHPIVVSKRSGYIVAGHARLEALRMIGAKKAPVDHQDFESDEQEYAFVQGDNAIATWAQIDLGMVDLDLKELGSGFDLELIGLSGLTLDPVDRSPKVGVKELSSEDFQDFDHTCPRCKFQFNGS